MSNNNLKVKQGTLIKKEEFNVEEIIAMVIKNWKWFLLSTFLFISVGVLYILMKSPVYYVDAAILLREDDDKSRSAVAMSMAAGIADFGAMIGSTNVDNEVGVLNTRMMMKDVVCQLGLNIICTTKKGLKTIDMYPKSPYIISVDSAQVDTIGGTIKFEIKPIQHNQYEISGKYKSEKFKTVISGFPAIIKTPAIDVKINKSPIYDLEEEDQRVKVTIHNTNAMAHDLGQEIKIGATSKKTSIISLALNSANVKKAKDIINTIISSYNMEAIKDKNKEALNTAAFVDERLAAIALELDSAEKSLEYYKRDNNFTYLASETKFFFQQMSEVEAKCVEAQIQINMVQFIEDYVRDEKNQDKMIPSVGVEDQGLQAIIMSYNNLLIEKNTLENASTVTNPSLLTINTQLATMRENIISTIKNVKGSLNVMYRDLTGQDKLMNSRMETIPRLEREYIQIARQKGIKERLYLYLLQKKEETNLSLASTAPKVKTIDIPMPGIKPIAPKKKIIIAAMIVLGLACPFTFFYLKQQLKTSIESKEELEKYCDVEIIGGIYESKNKKHVVVTKDSSSPEVELFRLLRANVLFKIKGSDKKVILITSTVAGEGKTFISVNLALSMAFAGKKVLLAGLDIRRPRLAECLNLPKINGISNYLAGEDISPDDLIQKSGFHPNLEIVLAGPVPPNPNELLLEDGLDELFSYYRTKYDYIIVDTAPIGIVSDTFLLDRIADMTLYISRIGFVYKDSVKNINAIVEKNSLRNLYVVANGIDQERGGYKYGYN